MDIWPLSQSQVCTVIYSILTSTVHDTPQPQRQGAIGGTQAARGGVNNGPGGGLSLQTRLIEKQIASNKACN